MRLVQAMLISWEPDEGEPHAERVCRIDEQQGVVVLIEVNTKNRLFFERSVAEMHSAFDHGKARGLKDDPFVRLRKPDEEIKEKHRALRDARWVEIEPMVKDPEIFNATRRGQLIQEASDRTGKCKNWYYEMIARYYEAGQFVNALLPHFFKCAHTKVISNEMAAKYRKVKLSLDHLDEEKTLINVYHRMNREYFHSGYDEQQIPVLLPMEERLTQDQFYHYVRTKCDAVKLKLSQKGRKHYNLNYRARVGDTTHLSHGPGFRYQLDGSGTKTYQVGRYSRKLVGVGRYILVTDTATRVITGVSEGLKNESYETCMLALECAFTNKRDFCRRYGIEINEEEWPIEGLPAAIMADRGPLRGNQGDNLVKSFGIDLDTTSPYRADMKGVVEWLNKQLKNDLFRLFPGAIPPDWERGDPDPALEACLDTYQMMQLLLIHIIEYNNCYRYEDFPLTAEQFRDGVEPYPLELWRWGMPRTSSLQDIDSHVVRMNLLPLEEASVTGEGLIFRKLSYTTDSGKAEEWAALARVRKRWKVSIRYDPRLVNYLYVQNEKGTYEPWSLHPRDKAFLGCTWTEVLQIWDEQRERKKAARQGDDQNRVRRDARIQQLLEAAGRTRLTRADVDGSREARTEEMNEERVLEAQRWAEKSFGVSSPSMDSRSQQHDRHEDEEDTPPGLLSELTGLWPQPQTKENDNGHRNGPVESWTPAGEDRVSHLPVAGHP